MLLSLQLGLCLANFVALSSGAALSFRNRDSARAPRGKVIVFGDSLSDNGSGAWIVSNHTWPKDPAYFGHRFSNGLVWVEDLAERLGMDLIDYAVGGATSNNTAVQGFTGPGSTIPVPSALDQVAAFLEADEVGFEDIIVIMTGANDIYFASSIDAVAPAITNIIHTLSERGAWKFLLASYHDLGRTPQRAFLTPSATAKLQRLSINLTRVLLNLRYKFCRGTDIQVGYVDVFSLFQNMTTSPVNFGFDNNTIDRSCLVGAYSEAPRTLCNNPDKYIFWDEYHPTRVVHKYIASSGWRASHLLCNNED